MPKLKQICSCNHNVYKIRPHAKKLLSTLWQFYELIGLANLPKAELLALSEALGR